MKGVTEGNGPKLDVRRTFLPGYQTRIESNHS
jgi:hypothetical protein